MKEFKELKTKKFTNDFVTSLKLKDGKIIETTGTCLPLDTELRGCMNKSGCPIKYKFCAVNKITKKYEWRNLTSDELINQVNIKFNKNELLKPKIKKEEDNNE